MAGALAGFRILEFTEIIAAPLGGMLLSDLGAEVDKVEPLEGEPWRQPEAVMPTESRTFASLNRGKRGIAVNLKTDEGRQVIYRLIPRYDAVIINYRPDTAAKLGIDYATLSAVNPQLVYMELTAFGRKGPDAHRPGYDIVVQALTGLMAADGKVDEAGVPKAIAPALADFTTGFSVAWAVTAGLLARERTGKGQKIEGSLLATALTMQTGGFMHLPDIPSSPMQAILERMHQAREEGASFAELQAMREEALSLRPPNAYYRCYFTADSIIAMGALSPALRRKVADAVGITDPRVDDPTLPASGPEAYAIASAVMAEMEARMLERTTDEWPKILDAAGVPAGPYYDVSELIDHPQVVENGLVAEVQHTKLGRVRMVGPMFKMTETPPEVRRASPALGEHTDEVLGEAGIDAGEIERLRTAGAIG